MKYFEYMSYEMAAAENEGMVYRGSEDFNTKRQGVFDRRAAYETLKAISRELGMNASDYRHLLWRDDAEHELFEEIIDNYVASCTKMEFKLYGVESLRLVKNEMLDVYRMEGME